MFLRHKTMVSVANGYVGFAADGVLARHDSRESSGLCLGIDGVTLLHQRIGGVIARGNSRLWVESTAEDQDGQNQHRDTFGKPCPQRNRRGVRGTGEDAKVGLQDGDAVQCGGNHDRHANERINRHRSFDQQFGADKSDRAGKTDRCQSGQQEQRRQRRRVLVQSVVFVQRDATGPRFDAPQRQPETGQRQADGEPDAKAPVSPIGVASSSPTSTSDEWLRNR